MLTFICTRLSSSLSLKSRIQLGLLHHNASHVFNSFSSASTLPESSPGKRKLGGNESFTVSYLMSSLGFSHKVAIGVSKKIHLKNPDKPNSVLDLSRNYGFSDTHISTIVKMHPRVLLAKPEKTLLPKLRFLQSIGCTNSELQDLLISNHDLLRLSLEHKIIPCYEALKCFLVDVEEAKIALKRLRWFPPRQALTNIAQNIKVLRDIGVPQSSVSQLAIKEINVAVETGYLQEVWLDQRCHSFGL